MGRTEKFVRLFHTIRHLKSKQIAFRLYYGLRTKYRNLVHYSHPDRIAANAYALKLLPGIETEHCFEEPNTFIFLNKKKTFEKQIDWNFAEYGKLWTYNLNYFDYLNQPDMTKEHGLRLIYDFISQWRNLTVGLEPFPISMRGINWIKFLTKYGIDERYITENIRAQYAILEETLEYHLLGNHLLENGFSLLYGAYFFRDSKMYKTAKKIILEELMEEILDDGAHFELSPMYHQLILYRLLECINLVSSNPWKTDELYETMLHNASKMLGWLQNITFKNGAIPLFNDSAMRIAPTTQALMDYTAMLNINTVHLKLGKSGYRVWKNTTYEAIVDVGEIGPDYIPGHAHSDIFNFELYIHGTPYIIDTGTSTYETNSRRQIERSTLAHNTVTVAGQNQSDVWGGFRVGERAKIIDFMEKSNEVFASHDGFRKLGVIHSRHFVFLDNTLIIEDIIKGKELCSEARLHFHPDKKLHLVDKTIKCDDIKIEFHSDGFKGISIENFLYAPEFNKLEEAQCVKVSFVKNLTTKISINQTTEGL